MVFRLFSLCILAGMAFAGPSRAGGNEPVSLPVVEGIDGLRPIAECFAPTRCAIRIEGEMNGRAVLSAPLPFEAYSAEVDGAADGATWFVGREENAVQIEMQRVSTPAGTVVLVHQTAGFDHVKRAHTLLAPGTETMQALETWVEGAGPAFIGVDPSPDGLTVRRRFADGPESTESYSWAFDGTGLSLREAR